VNHRIDRPLYVKVLRYVLFDEPERRLTHVVRQILDPAGQQIVEYYYILRISEEAVDQM
jgi:hypothetical protein